MATSPRVPPEERREPQLVPVAITPKNPNPSTSGVPGVVIAISVAVVLLGVILYVFARAPRATPAPAAAQVPQQPVAGQLQLSDLRMTLSPTGGSLYIDGQVMNMGPHSVTGILALVTFYDKNGNPIETVRRPFAGRANASLGVVNDEFTYKPIRPDQTRLFRLSVSEIPVNWNHDMPGVQVEDVTAEGK